jgi:hypothetical protein
VLGVTEVVIEFYANNKGEGALSGEETCSFGLVVDLSERSGTRGSHT